MTLIQYINSKREVSINKLTEVTDEEFRYYVQLRAIENRPVVEPKPKAKKERADKGGRRYKYDQSFSTKHRSYLSRANAKGLPFELDSPTFEYLIKQSCVYCKKPATGIDRRDNKKGYTISNSQPCCYTCNGMKLAMTESGFIEHIRRILFIHDNPDAAVEDSEYNTW